MNDTVVKVENVSKKFCRNLKRSMFYGALDVFKSMMGVESRTDTLRKGEFWSVDNVSFELKRGETLGIIGMNGSGKTTLLRMLNGIFQPDNGRIEINGRIGALIAVGAGFHPLLTGRENVYLNGAILGMNRREIDEKFDEIVEFAEIGEAIDSPVKHYSSGMYVRLGFSVAIHINPEVLLIDEVLSVGDLSFQNKSLRRLADMREKASAVIFVSHNLEHVRNLCSKILILHKGSVVFYGDTMDAIFRYHEITRDIRLESMKKENSAFKDIGHISTGEIEIKKIYIMDKEGKETEKLNKGEEIIVGIEFQSDRFIKTPSFSIGILNEKKELCIWQMSQDNGTYLSSIEPGSYQLKVCFKNPSLVPAVYYLTFAVRDSYSGEMFERSTKESYYFIVDGDQIPRGIVDCESHWELVKKDINEDHGKRLLNTVSMKDDKYTQYLEDQLKRTLLNKANSSSERVKYLLKKFIDYRADATNQKVISIGCRNIFEIKAFKDMGFEQITGIDLYSEDPSILIMDMHDIKFDDNTFDIIYSSHSLEHSYEPKKAVKEFIRIGKENAVLIVEVPVKYETTAADRFDFHSLDEVYKMFMDYANIHKIYFEETLKKGEENNFSGTDIIRTIFEIKK